VGGTEVAAQRLASGLAHRGVSVAVVAPGPDEGIRDLETGGTFVGVPIGERLELARAFRRWRRSVSVAVERLEPDLVHGLELLPGGLAAVDISGRPRVVTAHGNLRADTRAAYRGAGGWGRAVARDRLGARVVRAADAMIGVNPNWRINMPRPPRRFVYIPNAIDDAFFEEPPLTESGLVLFAGGTRAIKGWPLLASAWAGVRRRVPRARLHLVGWDGDPPSGVAPENVEGWIGAAELSNRLARAAVVVVPSVFEVAPLIVAEAWAVGVPVVAASVGGIPAFAGDAVVLVDREADAFAAAIADVLVDADGAGRVVAKGRERAEAHRVDAVLSAHLRLYDELS
jgi:glycosyltransferase involved in cell wall biosynthesis